MRRPKLGEWTMYCKTGCGPCDEIKEMLAETDIKCTVVNCDSALKDKNTVLDFMKEYTSSSKNHAFPFVIDPDGNYTSASTLRRLCREKMKD